MGHTARASWCLAALLTVAVSGCKKDDEIVWDRFNWDKDLLEVDITRDDLLGDPRESDLWSSVAKKSDNNEPVGSAVVEPGSGPIGTHHDLYVYIGEDFEEAVGRASIEVDSGPRGLVEYELQRDPAYIGTWGITIESLGSVGESRIDTIKILLWSESTEDGS
jgi:hypothetical protein